jgi:hypothetical protein
METLIILAGMTAREQIAYATKMIELVKERMAEQNEILGFDSYGKFQKLADSKAHYIVLLESGKARLDMF